MAQYVLMITYKNELHKYYLPTGEEKELVIGHSLSHAVTFTSLNQSLIVNWDGKSCTIKREILSLNKQLTIYLEDVPMSFYLMKYKEKAIATYDLAGKNYITIGANEYDDLQFNEIEADFVLIRNQINRSFELSVNNGMIYHNFQRVLNSVEMHVGDQLFFDSVLLHLGKDYIKVHTPSLLCSTSLTPLYQKEQHFYEDYPNYHRSPRIIYREPEDKRVIAKPSSKPPKPSEYLWRTILPPLVMILALALVSIFQPRGIYIIVMLAMTITTISISLTSYIKDTKRYKRETKERTESYKKYIRNKTEELYHASEEQRHALEYHYPNVEKIREMALEINARTYEKTMYHHDFLMYRVGLGNIDSSFELDFNDEEFSQEKDELIDDARKLYLQYLKISDVPIVTSLMKGPVGYIGQRSLVLEQLQLLVIQTAFFHSYHELQFIVIYPEQEKEIWDWMRWLPHAKLNDLNIRGFVSHERSRDQVLNSLYQILKERQLILEEKGERNEKTYFSPHYTILITDEKIILDHTIMEFFNEDPSKLGVSLVFVQDVMESLPEHVKTVIDIRDAKNGNVILEEGELLNQSFSPDHFPRYFNKEDISRSLAPLNHLQNLKSAIPETVTFLEMYQVEKVNELHIDRRWAQNDTYKSMAVPLGLRGKDDLVYLNLHEKAHGPHGLVAGTTGSGKSEIIQSYIISLAVNFHPYEVAFLLIDYKGGGMANLFKDLPHALGAITNLDGAQSMRALASIKAELEKRQRLFAEHDVNHINQYQKLYKDGVATEAMPHLFLISDEFAELKAEQPDFMKELVSTARIGRSLGIHLILATQKPSGVVDDQIWSNSKFKLALKVQNTSDSNEILKTPDAAEITLPGRAYLQVGNNEIYELFQSAWSGADYVSEKDDEELVDTTIYAINELGQYDILTEDLSGLEGKKEVSKTMTELEAVIQYISEHTEEKAIEKLPSPWLPPLKERIFLPELHEIDFEVAWQSGKKPLNPVIGFADFPSEQAQRPVKLSLNKDGHTLILSSPGFGKSTFIQTAVIDLARTHSPKDVHLYLLDFGTNGLLPLKSLPHVADTFFIDEEEKIKKLIKRLDETLKERKKKLSEYSVASIDMYEKASGEEVPSLLIVIDNYDAVRDVEFIDEFERAITKLAREGLSVGIHLFISAGRTNTLRVPLLSNIKIQIPLYLIDRTEVRSIVGRTELEIEEIPGRGLINLEEPILFQTALPVEGVDALDVTLKVQEEAKRMSNAWHGDRPKPIPMVPEQLFFNDFKQWKNTKEIYESNGVSIAIDTETVQPVPLYVNKDLPLVIGSDVYSKTIEPIKLLIDSYLYELNSKVIIIDSDQFNFSTYQKDVAEYGEGLTFISDIIAQLNEELEKRKEAVGLLRKEQGTHDEVRALVNGMETIVAVFTDYATVKGNLDSKTEDTYLQLLSNASDYKIGFIIGSQLSSLEGYDSLTKQIRETVSSLVFSELKNQNVYSVFNRIMHEKDLDKNEAYYIVDHMQRKVKVAIKS